MTMTPALAPPQPHEPPGPTWPSIGKAERGTAPDFSEPKRERFFVIDDEPFYCCSELPGSVAANFARMIKLDPIDQYPVLGEILEMVLLPESAERFEARMRNPSRPIGIKQVGKVLNWLLEEFAERPTQPSMPSTNSSEPTPIPTETPSTGGAPPGV